MKNTVGHWMLCNTGTGTGYGLSLSVRRQRVATENSSTVHRHCGFLLNWSDDTHNKMCQYMKKQILDPDCAHFSVFLALNQLK